VKFYMLVLFILFVVPIFPKIIYTIMCFHPNLNNLLKYIINTNVITREIKTMLICPLKFEQFNQGISEKFA